MRAVVFALWGCVSVACATDSVNETRSEIGGAAIGVEDSGHWYEYVCSQTCWRKQSFWIDLDVRNDAHDKKVAVVWTSDAWKTWKVSYASYEGSLSDGHERWGLDVLLGYFAGPFDRTEVEYAAFVEMGGVTSWDPANNHDIFQRVTRDRPVKLLDSKVSYEQATGAVLTGTVRVYNLAYQKQVTVVYTVDNWATTSEVEATWAHENDWTFRVTGLGTVDLPDRVQFALRYRAAGEEHWDSNEGYEYVHALEPQLYVNGPWSTAEEPASGIISLYGSEYSDLPLERLDVRIDAEPWSLGESGQSGRQLERSTIGLANGAHQIEVRALLKGGYETSAVASTFFVDNRFTPLGAWDPDFGELEPESDTNGWSNGVAVDTAGHVYLQWQEPWTFGGAPFTGVTRFASFGTNVAPIAYAIPPSTPYSYGSVDRLAADSSGRVYGLQRWPWTVWRWTTSGAIDTTFGNGGQLDFSAAIDGHYIDAIGDIVAGDGYLWVVGTCPSFTSCKKIVARFDDTGALAGVLELPAPSDGWSWDYAQPVAAYGDGALWIQVYGQLLRIGDDGTGTLCVLDSVALDPHVRTPLTDLVRTSAGDLFGLDSGGRLVAIGDDGSLQGAWTLYSYQRLLGGVRAALQLAILADGNIAVLDGDSGRLVVFDDQLAGASTF